MDLFKIGDLKHLVVNAHMYEEDLPQLYELRRRGPVHWSVRLQSTPDAKPQTGTVEEVGVVLDQTQHTALVQGFVDNPLRQLHIGQFVNAQIIVPAEKGTVEVPAAAVVDDGTFSYVFVVRADNLAKLERRAVSVVRRFSDIVQLRAEPTDAELAHGLKPLTTTDQVIVSGAVELNGAWKICRRKPTESPVAGRDERISERSKRCRTLLGAQVPGPPLPFLCRQLGSSVDHSDRGNKRNRGAAFPFPTAR